MDYAPSETGWRFNMDESEAHRALKILLATEARHHDIVSAAMDAIVGRGPEIPASIRQVLEYSARGVAEARHQYYLALKAEREREIKPYERNRRR